MEKERIEKVLSMLKSGRTAYGIAKDLRMSENTIAKIAKENGITLSRSNREKGEHRHYKERKPRANKKGQIIELYNSGLKCSDVARKLGISIDYAREIIREAGVGRYIVGKMPDEKVSEAVAENTKGKFTYVGGYDGTDSMVTIKCNRCGDVFGRSFVSIRHGRNITCPRCTKEQRKLIKERKEQVKEEQQRIKKITREFYKPTKKYKQIKVKECIVCGALFVLSSGKTCSEECARKLTNRRHDKRINEVNRKDNVTLPKLIKRDGGICWLCNKPIDKNDYTVTDEGYFIVGKNYPSIDHIKPISKGGIDSWDNVRLAHHRCNTLRRNSENISAVREKIERDTAPLSIL